MFTRYKYKISYDGSWFEISIRKFKIIPPFYTWKFETVFKSLTDAEDWVRDDIEEKLKKKNSKRNLYFDKRGIKYR